jgi:hypothetical protein
MPERVEVTCEECGKAFYATVEDQFGESPTEYCSRLCRMRAGQ